jgi:3-isopropylmalate dehydrogenase
LKIGVLHGDDIGYEVVPECVKVLTVAASRTNLEVEWVTLPIGKEAQEKYGHTKPDITVEGLKETLGWIMGPIGHTAYPRNDPTWIMPPTRKIFDLFASVKPVKSYPNIPSVYKNVDIVFLREVTEGMQSWTATAGGLANIVRMMRYLSDRVLSPARVPAVSRWKPSRLRKRVNAKS